MTITLELTPHVAASLTAQAQARGLPLDTYVRNLIEEQAAAVDHREQPMTLEPFEAELDALAADSETLPYLPAEALTRESFYQDHA
jgi:hypothetical protein